MFEAQANTERLDFDGVGLKKPSAILRDLAAAVLCRLLWLLFRIVYAHSGGAALCSHNRGGHLPGRDDQCLFSAHGSALVLAAWHSLRPYRAKAPHHERFTHQLVELFSALLHDVGGTDDRRLPTLRHRPRSVCPHHDVLCDGFFALNPFGPLLRVVHPRPLWRHEHRPRRRRGNCRVGRVSADFRRLRCDHLRGFLDGAVLPAPCPAGSPRPAPEKSHMGCCERAYEEWASSGVLACHPGRMPGTGDVRDFRAAVCSGSGREG